MRKLLLSLIMIGLLVISDLYALPLYQIRQCEKKIIDCEIKKEIVINKLLKNNTKTLQEKLYDLDNTIIEISYKKQSLQEWLQKMPFMEKFFA